MKEFYGNATLGEMKDALYLYNDNEILNVELTGEWYSYRGYYDQLAIEYIKSGSNLSTVGYLKEIINTALESGLMHGYKGGEFSVNENTEFCFCTSYNETGGLHATAVSNDFNGVKINVKDDD